jgi:hypothetical protein
MAEVRNAYKILVGMLEGARSLGTLRVDMMIIFKWILKK